MGVIRDRENSKYSTPLQTRKITKVLEGRRCPSRKEVIRRWKNVHCNTKTRNVRKAVYD